MESRSATIGASGHLKITVRGIISKTIRWLLRLDWIITDTVVDDHLQRNREALLRKQQEWAQMRSHARFSGLESV